MQPFEGLEMERAGGDGFPAPHGSGSAWIVGSAAVPVVGVAAVHLLGGTWAGLVQVYVVLMMTTLVAASAAVIVSGTRDRLSRRRPISAR